jgi:hypothetical protein
MDRNWGRIFGCGAAAVVAILAIFLFLKRGDRLEPTGSVLKERSIALNDTASLLLLDIRLVNDSDVVMTVDRIGMIVELKEGQLTGHILGKSDLDATFGYYPILGEKYNPILASGDQIPPRSKVDRMIAASFDGPLDALDSRQKVTVRITDGTGAAAEFTGK